MSRTLLRMLFLTALASSATAKAAEPTDPVTSETTDPTEAALQQAADSVSSRQLKEVVVKATRPLTKFENDGMITTLAGTPLAKIGSARDVLQYLPGMAKIDGNLTVLGAGSPIYYLNGRRLRDTSELDRLSSENIKDVTIIRSPGAKYGSNVQAVIKITTYKTPGDGFSLDSWTHAEYDNHAGGGEQLTLNYRKGGLDIFGTGVYQFSKSRRRAQSDDYNLVNGAETLLKSSSYAKSKSDTGVGKAGFNYVLSPDQTFGAYYIFSRENSSVPERYGSNATTELFEEGKLSESIGQTWTSSGFGNRSMVDAYYSGKWGRWQSDITFDYINYHGHSDSDTHESGSPDGDRTITRRNKSNNQMVAAEINLSKPLWHGELGVGGVWSETRTDNKYYNIEGILADQHNSVKESSFGAYVSLSQKFGKLFAKAGVRYEHTDNRIYVSDVKQADQSKSYDQALPFLTLSMPVGRTQMQLSYSRSYSRPSYGQLSSYVDYRNKFEYSVGDPNLKPAIFDMLRFNFNYKWMYFFASYFRQTDWVTTIREPYMDNPDITLIKCINSKKPLNKYSAAVNLVPGFIAKYWYPMLTVGVEGQVHSIVFRDRIKHMNDPLCYIFFNNMVQLPDNLVLSLNFKYFSSQTGHWDWSSPFWTLEFSGTKTFSKNWELIVGVNDIFNTKLNSRSVRYEGTHQIFSKNLNSDRAAYVTVHYKFNVARSKYRGQGAAQEEQKRL